MEARGEIFSHFSHEHPLELTDSSQHQITTCSGCRLDILPDVDFYHCKSCRYSLHKVCSEMPRQIQHSSHQIPNHSLILLLSKPPDNSYSCKACGQQINGFYYHCGTCSIFLHTLCSSLPAILPINPHPHPLKLEFSLHYVFSCNLCDKPGSNIEWLYRCNLCEFNSHISCAASKRRLSSVGEELMRLVGSKTRVRDNSKNLPGRAAMASPHPELSQQDDKSTLISIDLAPTLSCQFSDACFSIDLQKSYLGYNGSYQAEVRGGLSSTGEVKGPIRSGEKKLLNEETGRGSTKTKEITINEDIFSNWGVGSQMEKSRSASIGSIRTSSASKTANTLWKKLLCC